MDLLRNVLGYETIYVSKPTWGTLNERLLMFLKVIYLFIYL